MMLACRMAEERHYGCLTNFLNGTPESSLPQCAPFRVGVREINHSLSLSLFALFFLGFLCTLAHLYARTACPPHLAVRHTSAGAFAVRYHGLCVWVRMPRSLLAFVAPLDRSINDQKTQPAPTSRPPHKHARSNIIHKIQRRSGGCCRETCKGHDATVKW